MDAQNGPDPAPFALRVRRAAVKGGQRRRHLLTRAARPLSVADIAFAAGRHGRRKLPKCRV